MSEIAYLQAANAYLLSTSGPRVECPREPMCFVRRYSAASDSQLSSGFARHKVEASSNASSGEVLAPVRACKHCRRGAPL